MTAYFFGWDNFKWLVSELTKMYSNEHSFFSKKRIESGVAFIVMQWGMIFWLLNKASSMVTSDFLMWAGIEAVICGYTINQIQKEKKENNDKSS